MRKPKKTSRVFLIFFVFVEFLMIVWSTPIEEATQGLLGCPLARTTCAATSAGAGSDRSHKNSRDLRGALSHLSSLALQASHSLLTPLERKKNFTVRLENFLAGRRMPEML
jgi:hypothetical protein